MGKSNIEWTDYVFNPWQGCQKVSAGCDRCYAEAMLDHRYHKVQWGPHGERKRTSEAYWKQPLQWARKARAAFEEHHHYGARGNVPEPPHRPRVFCASLADWLDNQVPQMWRVDLRKQIEATPELDWLLLTKRPENYIRYSPWHPHEPLPPNVWLGFTAEDQAHFDRRWPIVRDIPAAVRFCSYEPALGPLNPAYVVRQTDTGAFIDNALDGFISNGHGGSYGPRLDWLICGGESGHGYRDMPLEWERSVREACGAAGVAYFQKQNAGKKPFPDGWPMVRQFPMAA